MVVEYREIPGSEKRETTQPDYGKCHKKEKLLQITAECDIFTHVPDFYSNSCQADKQN
jgi:hypothetical protein